MLGAQQASSAANGEFKSIPMLWNADWSQYESVLLYLSEWMSFKFGSFPFFLGMLFPRLQQTAGGCGMHI